MPQRKVLHSWKEIANYLDKSVRTVQRQELELKLPVRRPANKDRSAVMAFTDELDEWLQRAAIKTRPYVRPVLLVIDPPDPGQISNRKLGLELEKFNVLTAFSRDEVLSTAQRIDVDGFVLDCDPRLGTLGELCETLKKRYPKKPIFVILSGKMKAPRQADFAIEEGDPRPLLDAVLSVFGKPRLD
jgi:hypothetical protein